VRFGAYLPSRMRFQEHLEAPANQVVVIGDHYS
jgi:hypothetical protein